MTDPARLKGKLERTAEGNEHEEPADLQDTWNLRPAFGGRTAVGAVDPFAGLPEVPDRADPAVRSDDDGPPDTAARSVTDTTYAEQAARQRDSVPVDPPGDRAASRSNRPPTSPGPRRPRKAKWGPG